MSKAASQKKDKSLPNKEKRGKIVESRQLILKKDIEGTDYGQIMAVLGGRNFTVAVLGKILNKDETPTQLHCHLGGGNTKKIKNLAIDDIVLFGVREFQQNRGDIIYRYTLNEIRQLKKLEEFTPCRSANDFTDIVNDDLVPFNFDEI